MSTTTETDFLATTQPRPEIRWNVADAEYYADHSAVSQSMLKTFIEQPMLYHGRYVTGIYPPEPESRALAVGKAFHLAVLEPQRLGELAVAPEVDRRTKDGKATYAAFTEASAGKIVLTPAEHANVVRMADGILLNDTARALLEKPRETEAAFRWIDHESGIECKAKMDGLITDSFSYACVIDAKSTPDPTPEKFAKSAVEYGYDLQAAMYCRAASLYTGKPAVFVMIAVRKECPWDCWVHKLSGVDVQWEQAADRRLTETLAALRHAIDTDYWFAPGQHDLNTLIPPGWALERLGLR